MAANQKVKKAQEAQTAERRNLIAQYLRERLSYREMLEKLADHRLKVTSTDTISKDVKFLFNEWRDQRVTDTDDVAMTELARLTWVMGEAVQEWEKSKVGRKRIKAKYKSKKLDEKGKPIEGVKPDETEITTHYPERQYLEVITRTSESIRKLLGADAPEKSAFTDPSGKKSALIFIPDEEPHCSKGDCVGGMGREQECKCGYLREVCTTCKAVREYPHSIGCASKKKKRGVKKV